jgi:hypothetical protein
VDEPSLALHLAAVNLAGLEDYTDDMGANGDLPILQDTVTDDVWGAWGAVWRDVIVLDPDNERSAVYNLTTYDLAVEANRDALKQLLRDAALQ